MKCRVSQWERQSLTLARSGSKWNERFQVRLRRAAPSEAAIRTSSITYAGTYLLHVFAPDRRR